MADPLNKHFLDTIESRCSNITIANGYTQDIGKIDRARLKPFKGYDLPAVNIWCSELNNAIESYGTDGRTLSAYIEVHSTTRDEPFIDVCDRMAQDLITALNRDITAPLVADDESFDLGGICDDFIFERYEYQVGQGQEPFCAILAEFSVKYTVDQNTI